VQPDEIELTAQVRRVISLEPEQPIYRILIVEDRWENQQLLMELLHPVGFDLQVANNGQEGIDIWQTWQPHLILMDIRMPVLDGYAATQQIRALEAALPDGRPPTQIIAITSNAFEEDRVDILSAGCNDVISKPFQEEMIFAKLAEQLGVRYVYDYTGYAAPEAAIAPKKTDQAVIMGALKSMPQTWIGQLQEAAVQGRDSSILELIKQIPATDTELSNELESLVKGFQFEDIINLISI
jgi:CheY-like chemotaxis protein